MKRQKISEVLLLSVFVFAVGLVASCNDDDDDPSPQSDEQNQSNNEDRNDDNDENRNNEENGDEQDNNEESDEENDPGDDSTDDPFPERSYDMRAPSGYDEDSPAPLVMLIHGYGGGPDIISSLFDIETAADKHGFVLVRPVGATDGGGNRYWNATDACCAFYPDPADDVAFLEHVLDQASEQYNIDPKRIYIVGHSNGGFMTHRLACDFAPRIAAVASLAGVTWSNTAEKCPAADPISVLQIHGDMDQAIFYDGGTIVGTEYPSALETVNAWAGKNGCTSDLLDQPPNLDLEAEIVGDETRVQYVDECPAGGKVRFWTMLGGGHIPEPTDNWFDHIWAFLQANPKP